MTDISNSKEKENGGFPVINITSKHSLIHLGSLDSFDITEGGKAAAKCMIDYFSGGSDDYLKRAVDIYEKIIPNENFGGEYTALQWICRLLLAPEGPRRDFLMYAEVESWYNYLSDNNFAKLKEYLTYKYHFREMAEDDATARQNLRFLEDFILFANPDRNRWENTRQSINKFGFSPGDVIADVGAGPGYFSFKFADIVGESGKVYAIETNPMHLDYLNTFIKSHGINNVEVVKCDTESVGLDGTVKVNAIFMCSLYHVLYAALTEDERVRYLGSITDCLVPGGKLIIADNDLVEEGELPYHGPYIAKSLVISQLWHYGFRLCETFQFTKQRYILIFEYICKKNIYENIENTDNIKSEIISDNAGLITFRTGASLVNYRMADAAPTAGYTSAGREAASIFLKALEEKDETELRKTLEIYQRIIPLERIGDEYTAFEWVCKYLLSTEKDRKSLLKDELTESYFRMLCGDNFKILKKYLKTKYDLPHTVEDNLENLTQISEYICFNNPNRDSWEKTGKMLEYINIREGEAIADIGCGSGYFTYYFAKAAGADGIVYATELNKDALSFVERFPSDYHLNVVPVISRLNDANIPENSVDTIFMCSMYHAVYIASIEFVKDAFAASLKKALRKDGRLIVVDNDIQKAGIVPYYGSAIAKELVIAQLEYYGFKLIDYRMFIPQRYLLLFRVS